MRAKPDCITLHTRRHKTQERPDLDALIQELIGATQQAAAETLASELVHYGAEATRALRREVNHLTAPAQLAAVHLAALLRDEEAARLLERILEYGDCAAETPALRALGENESLFAFRLLMRWLDDTAEPDQLDVVMESLGMCLERHSFATWYGELRSMTDEALSEAQDLLVQYPRERLVSLTRAVRREHDSRKLQRFGTVLDVESTRSERAFKRERVLQAMKERLDQGGNRSFLLVGPAGVGKTVLLQELCRYLGPEGPADLILQTSSGLMMAGTRYLGEWQTRVNELVEMVRSNPRIVVYVTDINHLIGAGAHESSRENIADFFAPYMRAGALTLIGESTHEEMRRGLDQRPDFKRLFHVIQVEEPLGAETREIAEAVGRELAREVQEELERPVIYHNTFYTRLLEVADQFRSQEARPGRAVDLLKQTVDRVVRADATEELDEILLEPHHIIDTLVRSTGLPRKLLDDRDALDIRRVEAFFTERVLGQDRAIAAVVDLITLIKAGLTDPTKPTGVLFFVGPTGVGKTELAKALAEYIFGSQDRMLRLDMSEFMDPGSSERLIGSPHAPEASPHRQGLLTGRIRQQPFTVVLLDEFEKAHRSVYDLFLQVMDDGRLTDASGRVAHFTPAILVMTSNVGSAELFTRGAGFNPRSANVSDRNLEGSIRRELERVFRPEFVNRIDRIVPFRPLERDDIRRIVQREIGKVLMRSGIVRRNLTFDRDETLIDLLADKGFDPRYGARPLKREVERRLLLPLARTIVELGSRAERALLRLIAEDEEVRVEVIRSLDQENPLEGRELEPHDGDESDESRDARRLRKVYQELCGRVDGLEQHSAREGFQEKKTLLVQLSGQPSFWDKPELARNTLSQIHWIERVLTGLERVRKRTDDLGRFFDRASMRYDEKLVKAAGRLESVFSEVNLLEMALLCNTEAARADTFVTVERLDEHDFDPDPARSLLEMYMRWIQRLPNASVDLIDEKLSGDEIRSGTLIVQGLCPYGILSMEHGIHRMVMRGRDDDGRRDKVTAFCRVDVRPFIDDPQPRLGKREVRVQRTEKRLGRGLLVPRYRSRIRLVHKPTDMIVVNTSDKPTDEAENLAKELLRSMLVHRRAHLESPEESGKAVRTYTFGDHARVRDETTGVSSSRIDDVLDGQLDPFLKARLEARAQAES